jgi:hypothetical protein
MGSSWPPPCSHVQQVHRIRFRTGLHYFAHKVICTQSHHDVFLLDGTQGSFFISSVRCRPCNSAIQKNWLSQNVPSNGRRRDCWFFWCHWQVFSCPIHFGAIIAGITKCFCICLAQSDLQKLINGLPTETHSCAAYIFRSVVQPSGLCPCWTQTHARKVDDRSEGCLPLCCCGLRYEKLFAPILAFAWFGLFLLQESTFTCSLRPIQILPAFIMQCV